MTNCQQEDKIHRSASNSQGKTGVKEHNHEWRYSGRQWKASLKIPNFLLLVRRETAAKLFHLKNKISGFGNQLRALKSNLQSVRKLKKNGIERALPNIKRWMHKKRYAAILVYQYSIYIAIFPDLRYCDDRNKAIVKALLIMLRNSFLFLLSMMHTSCIL